MSLFRRRREVGRDLAVHPGGILFGETARVGKNIERGGGLLQRPSQVFDRPRRQNGDAVDGLGARRVVVEYGKAPAALAYLAPDPLQGVWHTQFGRLRGQVLSCLDSSRRLIQRRTPRTRVVLACNELSISGCGGGGLGRGHGPYAPVFVAPP